MTNNKKILIGIVLFTIVIRLYHISFPLIGWQSWRQADTASIAKNFFLNGHNILYPQIEWRGNTPGYVESEFHIYPLAVSYIYSVFGVNEMWGRLLSVIFAVFTVYGVFLLVRKIISERTALWSAFIYSILPLNIYFARAFMPESFMLMCSVYGIYFYTLWTDDDKWKSFFLSSLFIMLAVLVKLPELYLGVPLCFLTINKFGKSFLLNRKIWIYSLIVLIPVILWYYHAHQLFLQTGLTFGIWEVGKSKWGMIDPLLSFKFYNDIFFKSIAERHLTYAAFIVFIWGLFLKRSYVLEKLFDWWLIGMLMFIFIAPQAHLAQEYYQLPFNIPASVFIGKVFSKYFSSDALKQSFVKNRLAVSFLSFCLLGILILSFLRMSNFMKSEDKNAIVFRISDEVNVLTKKDELIITPSGGNPTFLYIFDRRGWTPNAADLTQEYITKLKDDGAKFIVSERSAFKSANENDNLKNILLHNELLKEDEQFFIIKLK